MSSLSQSRLVHRALQWLEHVVAGDQDRLFELFITAAIGTSLNFSIISPTAIEAHVNQATVVILVLALMAHFTGRLNRGVLTVGSFCVIVADMAGGIYFHGGAWSLNAVWFLTLPLPVLMIVGLRAALFAIGLILTVVFTMFALEVGGYLPPPIQVPDHLDWWWMCIALLSFNIWVLPMIAHVTQQRMLSALRTRNEELERTQHALVEETEQQDLFVASVSHELRTPMNAIMGFMQTMEQSAITHGANAKMFAAMNHSARHLLTVINDLLDFSQIQTDSLRVAYRPMALRELFGHFESMFATQLSERGIRFEVDIAPDVPPWAMGDPDRLSQIVINLLGNATKFTRQGMVRLAARVTPSHRLHVEVRDTGRGIAADQLDQVFERFSRLTVQTQKAYGGTGLGLSISSNLIKHMGGHIGVTSELGQGSCFWFDIPLTPCAAPSTSSSPTPNDAPPSPADTPRVSSALIVDDSMVNRLVAKQMMLQAFPGIRITEADNGLNALHALSLQRFDIVLMDVIMPEMDGIEATQRIGQTYTPAPPVIGLTADVTEGVETRCRQAGMFAVLTKPYERQILIQRVHQALLAARANP